MKEPRNDTPHTVDTKPVEYDWIEELEKKGLNDSIVEEKENN